MSRGRMTALLLAVALYTSCTASARKAEDRPSTRGPLAALQPLIASLHTGTHALVTGAPAAEAFPGFPTQVPEERLVNARNDYRRSGAASLLLAEFEMILQYCQDGQPTGRYMVDLAHFGALGISGIRRVTKPVDATVCEGKTKLWPAAAYTGQWAALGALARGLGEALADAPRCQALPLTTWSVAAAMYPSAERPGIIARQGALREAMKARCREPARGDAVYVRYDDVTWAAVNDRGALVGEVKIELNYRDDGGLELELIRWVGPPE